MKQKHEETQNKIVRTKSHRIKMKKNRNMRKHKIKQKMKQRIK